MHIRSFLISSLLVSSAISFSQDVAITNAKIVTGTGKVIKQGTILIQSGRIVSVGSGGSFPAGIATFDGTGLTAYPGFIDGYTTKGLKLPSVPEAAVGPNTTTTAPATMWAMNRKGIRGRVSSVDCLDIAGAMEDAHKAGIVAGLLAPGSGIIRGRTAFALFTDEKQAATPESIEISFRGTGGGGPGGGGGGTGYNYPGTLLGFVALLRQTLYDAQAYGQSTPTKEDLDLKGIAPLFRESVGAVIAADSDVDIYRAMKLAEEFNFKFAISGGRDAFKRSDQLAKMGIPVLANISIGSEPSLNVTPDGPPKSVLEDRLALWKTRSNNVMELVKAGVDVALSSEGSGFDDYLANARKLIKLGLTEDQCLKAMTSTPAKIFKVDKDMGSLEPKKLGNVVLMSGDMADEKSEVKAVFVAGKKFEVKK